MIYSVIAVKHDWHIQAFCCFTINIRGSTINKLAGGDCILEPVKVTRQCEYNIPRDEIIYHPDSQSKYIETKTSPWNFKYCKPHPRHTCPCKKYSTIQRVEDPVDLVLNPDNNNDYTVDESDADDMEAPARDHIPFSQWSSSRQIDY